jgi:UDP:flavonoid glycosyltransferase YjiC (YdhE family)
MTGGAGTTGGRFLLAIIDGGGTVPPALGVAAELIRRGHAVRVLADPTVEISARAAGCSFTPWRLAPHFDSLAEQTALLAKMEGRNPYRQFTAARDLIVCGPAAAFAEDVVATVRDHPVDAILGEAAVPGILIGAQATGLPTAALMANIYLRPTPGLPTFGTGWSPAKGRLGRVRDSVGSGALRRLWSGSLPAINGHLTSYGLAPIGDLYQLFDRCTRVLVLTSPSFDFQTPHLPGNVSYVGPQLDDPDWAATDQTWRPGGGGPLVLVSMSSIFQDQTDVLRRVAAGLGQLPVRAVVTTGRAVDPTAVDAPPNVSVLPAAPHRRVLADASAVVTHAGHGTLLKALAAGVPVVCMPMGRDQRDNTVRAVRLGAAVRVGKGAGPGQIAAGVSRVLNEPRYAEAAQRFAAVLTSEARTRPSAADEAEKLLISAPSPG